MAQVVEHLSSKCKALSSYSNTMLDGECSIEAGQKTI
jgi:hypothetical protein